MKVCTKCKEEKLLEDFHKRTRNKTDGRSSVCKICKALIDSTNYSKPEVKQKVRQTAKATSDTNRQKLYDYLKDKECLNCGENHIACLQFDHRDPSHKVYEVSNIIGSSYSWSTIKKEIDKCDILCANCHAKRTAIQFNYYKDLK